MPSESAHPTIRVDFQNADSDGRVRLNTAGTQVDLATVAVALEPGLTLLLEDGELSATGHVEWSDAEQVWVATVDWDDVVPE